MKFKNILTLLAVIAVSLCTLPAFAMSDASLTLTAANPGVDATNATASIDLGSATPDIVWKQGYLKATIPALANATNSAKVDLFILQDSADNVTFAKTIPTVQGEITGATSATNTTTTIRFPIPKDVKRYIRVQQIVPTLAGDNSTVTNTYTLVIP